MKKYLIIVEETGRGYSAYSPDLLGCVATGKTRAEVESNMCKVLSFHLNQLREDGDIVPEPHTYSAYVEFPA